VSFNQRVKYSHIAPTRPFPKNRIELRLKNNIATKFVTRVVKGGGWATTSEYKAFRDLDRAIVNGEGVD
jgi:hypothetical protein